MKKDEQVEEERRLKLLEDEIKRSRDEKIRKGRRAPKEKPADDRRLKLLSIDELRTVKGINLSRASIYRMCRDGRFVKPIRLTAGRIAFIESEVDDWIRGRERADAA